MDSPFKGENKIFRTKEPFEEGYTPEEILERATEIEEYSAALQDVLDGFAPPNVFIYGQTGVGKTATTKKVLEFLEAEAEQNDIPLHVFRINCVERDTTYKVIRYLANQLHPDTHFKQGHHSDDFWDLIYKRLDEIGGNFIVVLDEIDKLGEDESLLYNFPRADSNELDVAKVGIIGISNNFKFRENLSPRVKSTLAENEIQFAPYNANQLRTILTYYADEVFVDDALSDDVVPLVAAFTAQDTGDARMALDLLETAGDVARHEGAEKVTEEHVRVADDKVDRANTKRIVEGRLTTHMQVVLMAIALLSIDPDADVRIKTIYSTYKDLCTSIDADQLSNSRVRDHIATLDMFGLIETDERNLGRRGGRAYVYSLVDEPRIVIESLEEVSRLGDALPPSTEHLLQQHESESETRVQRELDG